MQKPVNPNSVKSKLRLPLGAASKPAAEPLRIRPAFDGVPITADLPEHQRKMECGRVAKTLTPEQLSIIDRVVDQAGAGDNHPETLGLRLMLAAAVDKHAGAWPLYVVIKALEISGRPQLAHALRFVVLGCRASRFGDMAACAIDVIERRTPR